MRRHGTAWVETLRYRKAEFEAMSGLRRITLNDNILIGDRGAMALSRELAEDLWVKGLTSHSSTHTLIYVYIYQKHIDTHIPVLYSPSSGPAALWDLK